MSTPQDIVVAALAYSTKNKPSFITSREAELFEVVMRAMRRLYLFSVKINPEFFGISENIAFAAGGWARPALALSIWRIENPGTNEVIVVPREQLQADEGRPAVYRLGQKFYSAGNALDPVSGTLTFFYTKKPTVPATFATAFSADWPTDFDGLLVAETAIYLARQDGRTDEAATIKAERDEWAGEFASFLETEQLNVVYLYGNAKNYNIPDLIKTTLARAS